MSIKFFGQFLLEKKAVTTEALLKAIRFQESRNLKFGQYALENGYLSDEDLERLHSEQKNTDLRIGELAVNLGMLTEAQVQEVLTMQRNDHVQIGQALVATGALDEAVLGRELEAYRADQSELATGATKAPEGMKSGQFVGPMVDLTLKMLRRVAQVEAKCSVGEVLRAEPAEVFAAVSVTFSGGVNCEYALLAAKPVATAAASGVVGAAMDGEPDDMLLDGFKEFANIVCGNIIALMAKKGKNVEISIPHLPPYTDRGYGLTTGAMSVTYTLATPAGSMQLVVMEY